MVKKVIRMMNNDMVAVFSMTDQQMPEFQGPYTPALKEKILAAASEDTRFYHNNTEVSRENW